MAYEKLIPAAEGTSTQMCAKAAHIWGPGLRSIKILYFGKNLPAMHGGFHAQAIGFGFERVILNHGSAAAKWVPDAAGTLL